MALRQLSGYIEGKHKTKPSLPSGRERIRRERFVLRRDAVIRLSSLQSCICFPDTAFRILRCEYQVMKLTERIKETGATGYILLWLLGIPLPILFIVFLLRGCT